MSDTALTGRVIWVTRPQDQADELCRLIAAAGGKAVRVPVLDIQAELQLRDQRELSVDLSATRLLIFVSRNAVTYAPSVIPGIFETIAGKTILAIGAGTQAELSLHGLTAVCSGGGSSEALLQLEQVRPESIKGKHVLIVRGVGGRDTLAETLRQRGAEVKYLEVYRRTKPVIEINVLENTWRDTPPDVIVVTSVEGLRNLINMTSDECKARLFQTPLAVMSARIQSAARSLGFRSDQVVAAEASDNGLVQAMFSLYGDRY